MRRLVISVIAIMCVVVGLIALPTPIPLGAILLAVGFSLLVLTSVTVRNFLRRLRVRFPELDGSLKAVDGYLPRSLQRALRLSAPRQRDKT